jgi:hypothetical protein
MLGVGSLRQIPSSPGEGQAGQKALPTINDEEKVKR